MTARVSFFPTPTPQSAGEATVPAPAAETKSAAAPFSRMLDHAVRDNPSRNQKPVRSDRAATKEAKPRSTDTTDHTEAKAESESRPARVKSGKRDQETAENQNLADTCSTTAPVAPKPTEETAAKVEAEASAATAVAPEGQEAEGKVATTSGETARTTTKLPTSAETPASAGLDVSALMTPVEATDAEAVSLLNTLTPATVTEGSNAAPNTAETNKAAAALMQTAAATETEIAETAFTTPVEIPLEQAAVTELQNFSAPPSSPTTNSIEAANIAVATEFSPANIATDSGLATTAAQSAATLTKPTGSADVTVSSATAAVATSASVASATTTSAPEDVRRSVRAARLARLEGLETAAGTGGAKSSATMKTAIKKEEIAGNAEQFLPVASPNALSALRNLPGDLNRAATGQFSSLNGIEAAGSTNATAPGTDTETLFVRSNSPMNRISEVISREIRMFKRGGDDLVEVVLTPDTKTQISLRLQWRDGQVEVQARCDLGNYQSLNTEWPQLQQSLANHGVRLSHLSERVPTGFTEFFNNPGFAQQQRRDEPSQSNAGAADAIPALPATGKPSATPIVRRGGGRFDSWA